MDPSIMKLLEDDEDETMHSGAEVEAFTAALNRDIGRDDSSDIAPPIETSTGMVTQGMSGMPSQLPGQRQAPSEEINPIQQSQQKDVHNELQFQEQQSSQVEPGNQQSSIQNMHDGSNNLLGQNQTTPNQEMIHPEQQQQQQQSQHQHQELQQTLEPNNLKPVDVNQAKFSEQPHVQPHEEGKGQNRLPYSSQQLNSQQPQPSDQTNNPMRRMRLSSIPFHSLIPVLRPHLDKDRSMQLNNVFSKLKSNDISRDDFLRVIRNIVGDQMLRQAAHKVMQQQAQALAARNSQMSQGQHQFQTQASSQHIPSRGTAQFPEHHPFSQVQTASSSQHQIGRRSPPLLPSSSSLKAVQNDNQIEAQGLQVSQVAPTNMAAVKHEREAVSLQTANKQQNLSQVPPTTFSMHGNAAGNFNLHSFPRAGVNSPAILKAQVGDSQIRQLPLSHVAIPNQSGTSQPINLMNVSKYETQTITSETKRLPGSSLSTYSSIPTLQQKQIPCQQSANKEQISLNSSKPHVKQELVEQATESQQVHSSPATPAAVAGTNAKTPQRKPITGQKKPADLQVTPPAASKKQKHVAFQDQSIDQLNDVTAVSGVNLREEEEQLLSAPKEESHASEAARKAVQEEEERLILQKLPLQKKIAQIISKSAIETTSSDVARCLSMCVEERLRGLIAQLIRLSKQRADIEKGRHRIVFTSDVRRQVLEINRQAKEEWDRKQAEEAEKLRKQNETEGGAATDTEKDKDKDKDKDETRCKAPKANKEEDDKMRTTAANVAARVAFGGDDMLSKWQLMAEQARQKREGGIDSASGSQPGKASAHRTMQTVGGISTENQEGDKKGGSNAAISGAMRRVGRNQHTIPHPKVSCSISTKDVIAVLEREPQMSKSPLLYRLYERLSGDARVE